MQFQNLVIHRATLDKLLAQYRSGRISHARLFVGDHGYGGLPLAIAYAQYLCCTARTETDSCGSCSSCIKFEKLAHPDLHFIFPVATTDKVTSKPVSKHFMADWREALVANPYMGFAEWFNHLGVDKKQGNISAEESHEIIKQAALKPFESEYKFFIIWMADKMNSSASNKLLKIIEEPPPKTLFFLISESSESLLATILSRVQISKMGRIDDGLLSTYLQRKHGLEAATADKISLMADGSVAEARKLLGEDAQQDFYFEAFSEWARFCFKPDIQGILGWVDKMSAIGREKQKYFLMYGLMLFRESILQNYSVNQLSRIIGKEADFKSKFAPFVHHNNVAALTEELEKASYHIERNANAKIVFLDLSLKVVKLLKIKSVTLS
jgi:DNA polymerase-3 subunit delta'